MKAVISFLVATLFFAESRAQSTSNYIPSDAIEIEGKFYKYFAKPGISWDEADREARQMKATLAVNLFTRYTTFENLKLSQSVAPGTVFAWTGLTRVSGKTVDFGGSPITNLYLSTDRGFDSTNAEGRLFLAPKTPASASNRELGIYMLQRDDFPLDGYICEWAPDSTEEIPETMHLGTLTDNDEEDDFYRSNARKSYTTSPAYVDLISKDGKTLKAVIHGMNASHVKVRNSQFQSFTIPLSRLSESSVANLKTIDGIPSQFENLSAKCFIEWKETTFSRGFQSSSKKTGYNYTAYWRIKNESSIETGKLYFVTGTSVKIPSRPNSSSSVFYTKVIDLKPNQTVAFSFTSPTTTEKDDTVTSARGAFYKKDKEVFVVKITNPRKALGK